MALVSVDGHVFAAGDADVPFTAQSVSKPFVYRFALADLGLDEVFRHVGAEPNGEPFNAISLEPTTGRPANLVINAGAIVTSALVRGADAGVRFERIRSSMSAFAGRSLDVVPEQRSSTSPWRDRSCPSWRAVECGTTPASGWCG
ncbi:MAG: glutaminase [Jiangellaceae bacterium]